MEEGLRKIPRLDVSFSECSDHEHETSHETVSCFMKLSHETFHIQGIADTEHFDGKIER